MVPMAASDGAYGKMLDTLLASPEPSIQWKVRTGVLGEARDCAGILALRQEIGQSERVKQLLAPLSSASRPGAYSKWQGAHWVLAALADLGYPPGDPALFPLREQILDTWLDASYYMEFEATAKSGAYRRPGVPVMEGRHRRCASQQGNALWFLINLGLADSRCDDLAERLLHWQWPDGGWNCDKNPAADTSSFCETLLPMRGLAAYSAWADAAEVDAARIAARRAAEVLLIRRLAYRVTTGELIHPQLAELHYPLYWHYDLLGGLKGLLDLSLLSDERCADALDLLESLQLASGWPAHARYYRAAADIALHHDFVDWGGASARRANPWVTADALAVLHAAGRFRL
jgi:hypothetical protein